MRSKLTCQIILMWVVLAIFTASVTAVSCKIEPEGVSVLTGDYTAPKLLSYTVTGDKEMELVFSKHVELENITITLEDDTAEQASLNAAAESAEASAADGDAADGISGSSVTVTVAFAENTVCGKKYSMYGVASDSTGNSLSFSVSFTGYNSRVPKLLLSEIRSEYLKPKVEFVELYALSDGNLGGMELSCGSDGDERVYIFPASEVKAGEYFVLHFRNVEEGSVSETEIDDYSSATATGSNPASRDFWINDTKTSVSKSDVILLRERAGGLILDAVLFCETKYTEWAETLMAQYAAEALSQSVWTGGAQPSAAVCSDYTTTTRTLSRINIGSLAGDFAADGSVFVYPHPVSRDDWIIVSTGGATPGTENSMQLYVPKTSSTAAVK